MTTGERLRVLRKQLGISADDVAKALNVSRATIFRYEKGDIEKVPGSKLEPLAKVLHTTPAYLMGWEEPSSETKPCETSFAPDAEDIALLKKYHALDERGKMMVESVLEAEYQHMQPTLHVVAAANGHGATFEERDELPPLLPEDPPDI